MTAAALGTVLDLLKIIVEVVAPGASVLKIAEHRVDRGHAGKPRAEPQGKLMVGIEGVFIKNLCVKPAHRVGPEQHFIAIEKKRCEENYGNEHKSNYINPALVK